MKPKEVRKFALEILDIEAAAIRNLRQKIGGEFQKAIQIISACKGRVIWTDMVAAILRAITNDSWICG